MTYANTPTADSQQIIIVISKAWSTTSGMLQRYERLNTNTLWRKVGQKIKVVLGKNGMGWGIGLHGTDPITEGPIIAEGSNRSPAGAFTIPFAFGKDVNNNLSVKLPYKQISNTIFCVDDSQSKNYNNLVDTKSTIKDWDSAENMQTYVDDGLYTYGAMLGHNMFPAVPGKGSCFFIHVWRRPNAPTAGCTAMEKNNIKKIISWIDPHKKPVFIQLPEVIYNELKSKWKLPELT